MKPHSRHSFRRWLSRLAAMALLFQAATPLVQGALAKSAAAAENGTEHLSGFVYCKALADALPGNSAPDRAAAPDCPVCIVSVTGCGMAAPETAMPVPVATLSADLPMGAGRIGHALSTPAGKPRAPPSSV